MRQVEILAPAGSYDALVGAVNGGCDAVYVGGSSFGARAFADNFDKEAMLRAIDYVHLFDKKLYLTVNTLLYNEEIEEELYEYMAPFYEQGLDAAIVQDPGVLSFLHRNFPKLDLHASTQMTFTTEQGGELLKNSGVTRFVTSRELSIQEISEIRKKTNLEIETFVHGALCYCYSGQCFLSSMIGGRSGNRGRCAQPCRMPYQMEGERLEQPYLLSPKDMCTLDSIPDLVDAGIDSFKIEGRMKRAEYAAYTSYLYRKYTDLYLEYGEEYDSYLRRHQKEVEYDYTCLMDLYNRGGFSKGYFYKHNSPKQMSMLRPNHSGVLVGKVSGMKKNHAFIDLCKDIYGQDVLEFRREDGTVLYEYTVKENVSLKVGRTETNTKPGTVIKPGTAVYRTRRNQLLATIQKTILEEPKKRQVTMELYVSVGEEIKLKCSSGECLVEVNGKLVDEAKSQPMTQEKLSKPLKKLNKTNFFLKECKIEIKGNVFVPVGHLNELRRNALEKLEKQLIKKYRRQLNEQVKLAIKQEEKKKNKVEINVLIQTEEQGRIANSRTMVDGIYLDMGTMSEKELLNLLPYLEKKCYLVLPAILRASDYQRFEKAFKKVYVEEEATNDLELLLADERVTGFLLKNYEAVSLYLSYAKKGKRKLEARLDYNMYTCNREAKSFWLEQGIAHSTASVELNAYQWRKNGCQDQEIIVYGRPAVMTSAQCVQKNTDYCSKTMSTLLIKDRFDKKYLCKNRCSFCYNQMYEQCPTSLHEYAGEILEMEPEMLRIEFVDETAEQAEKILKYVEKVYIQNEEDKCPYAYQTGHFRKGIK